MKSKQTRKFFGLKLISCRTYQIIEIQYNDFNKHFLTTYMEKITFLPTTTYKYIPITKANTTTINAHEDFTDYIVSKKKKHM